MNWLLYRVNDHIFLQYSEYQKVKRKQDDDEVRLIIILKWIQAHSSIPLVATGKTAKEKYLEKNLEETKMVS